MAARIAAALPPNLKLLGWRRTTGGFDCRKMADKCVAAPVTDMTAAFIAESKVLACLQQCRPNLRRMGWRHSTGGCDCSRVADKCAAPMFVEKQQPMHHLCSCIFGSHSCGCCDTPCTSPAAFHLCACTCGHNGQKWHTCFPQAAISTACHASSCCCAGGGTSTFCQHSHSTLMLAGRAGMWKQKQRSSQKCRRRLCSIRRALRLQGIRAWMAAWLPGTRTPLRLACRSARQLMVPQR